MERIIVSKDRAVAANASGRVSICPPSSTEIWELRRAWIIPNETSAVDATHYADLTLKKGSTALCTTHTTSTTALTQNTPVNLAITAVGSNLACTQAAPHHFLIDATPGNGVAVDVSVFAEYEAVRP